MNNKEKEQEVAAEEVAQKVFQLPWEDVQEMELDEEEDSARLMAKNKIKIPAIGAITIPLPPTSEGQATLLDIGHLFLLSSLVQRRKSTQKELSFSETEEYIKEQASSFYEEWLNFRNSILHAETVAIFPDGTLFWIDKGKRKRLKRVGLQRLLRYAILANLHILPTGECGTYSLFAKAQINKT